jgi:hypothetical protein
MAYTYILRSQKDGRLYYGSTEDLKSRLKAHTAGKVRSTKSRRPLVLSLESWQNGYCTGLENRRPQGLGGSNPSLSAMVFTMGPSEPNLWVPGPARPLT